MQPDDQKSTSELRVRTVEARFRGRLRAVEALNPAVFRPARRFESLDPPGRNLRIWFILSHTLVMSRRRVAIVLIHILRREVTIMMRWLLLAVMVVALTAGATVAFQFLPAETSSDDGRAVSERAGGGEQTGRTAFAEVDATHPRLRHHGPVQQRQAHLGHQERGRGRPSAASRATRRCSCTIASLKDGKTATVKPGEETTVELEWDTKDRTASSARRPRS